MKINYFICNRVEMVWKALKKTLDFFMGTPHPVRSLALLYTKLASFSPLPHTYLIT